MQVRIFSPVFCSFCFVFVPPDLIPMNSLSSSSLCCCLDLSSEKIDGSPIGIPSLGPMASQANGPLPGGGNDFMSMLGPDESGDTGAGSGQASGLSQHRASPAIAISSSGAIDIGSALSQSTVSQNASSVGVPSSALDKVAGLVGSSTMPLQANPGIGFPMGVGGVGPDSSFMGPSGDLSTQVRWPKFRFLTCQF